MRQLMLNQLFKLMISNSYILRRFMLQYKGKQVTDKATDKIDLEDVRQFMLSLTDEGLLQLWDATITYRRGY